MKKIKVDKNDKIQKNFIHNTDNEVQQREQLQQQANLRHNLTPTPYQELNQCVTPDAILLHYTDIPGDGNCLFHSLIKVLKLKISTQQLRKQLLDSPYLHLCGNQQNVRKILSSASEYGDMDCLFIVSRAYNQNICVHFHFFNKNTKAIDARFCLFRVNHTQNIIHLHLFNNHYTPYIGTDDLIDGIRTIDNVVPIPNAVVLMQDVCYTSIDENELELDNDQNEIDEIEIEIENVDNNFNQEDMEIDVEVTVPVYSNYKKHSIGHFDFYKNFTSNTFGHSCAVCDRLWWKRDLKMASEKYETILLKILKVTFSIFQFIFQFIF